MTHSPSLDYQHAAPLPEDAIYLFTARGKDVYYSSIYWENDTYPVNPIEDTTIFAFLAVICFYWLLHSIVRSICAPIARRYVIHDAASYVAGTIPNYKDVTDMEIFKFENSVWRFVCYGVNFSIGMNAIIGQDWVFKPGYCDLWPEIPFPLEMRMYYICTAASYTYATIRLFIDPRQKDHYEMLLHHVVTVFEVTVSWYCGYVRIGTLVIILTDIADPFLEMAKCMLYTGNIALADIFFALFAVVFMVTRNVIYPLYILYDSILYGFNEDGFLWKSHIPLAGGLWILQILFIFWGYLLIKAAVGMYINKQGRGDIRDEDL